MREAKYSFNIRCNQDGYDWQLTIGADGRLAMQLTSPGPAGHQLASDHGAPPERHWEANGKNGRPDPKSEPECAIHHKAARSKFCGLYCPGKDKDGSYCDWKAEEGE